MAEVPKRLQCDIFKKMQVAWLKVILENCTSNGWTVGGMQKKVTAWHLKEENRWKDV